MLHSSDPILIGIDGGGTLTRVLVSDSSGTALAYAEGGPASIHKDVNARRNVQEAIRQALAAAGRTQDSVIGLAAGIAGFDSEADREWVESLTDVPGLGGSRWHVNDAVVAHCGALMAKPGIIVIAGTGSIIAGIPEDGTFIRNYDFGHYAAAAARFLAYDAVYEALAGRMADEDAGLIQAMLSHWRVGSLAELSAMGRHGFGEEAQARNRTFGLFAPAVTAAADRGSPLAVRVCERAVEQIAVGVELLARSFATAEIEVALIGGVANSGYVSRRLHETLAAGRNARYRMTPPRYPPVVGAVLLAMTRLGLSTAAAAADRLGRSALALMKSS
ncbi:BadF/BadG/BcrA/BcrD ATPase family protein [Cohnella zeiphila]|uniref:ATPase n=1 Tax=Cohnella zeiphila TaxID=2761120 RepID=A0A7X0VU63_9BACL|nr:BadF/BadG/BcrA/BcrD ATPase family protein [Cohnella zeiphila]MBB6729937.1 ATPase [Cohnella zeiphila]